MHNIKGKTYEIARQVVDEEGAELVSVDIHGRGKRALLRVVVDKEGGITVDECAKISRGIEALLDVEDLMRDSYVLEVTSPGIDRPLVTISDYIKHMGKLARIITKERISNQTFFIGRIVDAGDSWVRLQLSTGADRDVFIPLDMISKARLEIEF